MAGNIRKAAPRLAVVLLIPWFLFWGWSYYSAHKSIEEAFAIRCGLTSHCDRDNPFTEIELAIAEPNVPLWRAQQTRALWIGAAGPIVVALFLLGSFWVWRGYRSTDENGGEE